MANVKYYLYINENEQMVHYLKLKDALDDVRRAKEQGRIKDTDKIYIKAVELIPVQTERKSLIFEVE